ncbi:MAG: c-type cytochrome domain-containing protein [Phycisphaerales bacterium]
MRGWTTCCVVVMAATPGIVAPVRGDDLSAQTLDIFQQRCAACHGTAVEKPRGKFGFIDDLRRLVKDRDYIAAGDAEASELWRRISDPDPDFAMPPQETKHGQLTRIEKETIRQWINEGAKVPADSGTTAATTTAPQPAFSAGRAVAFVGRFHPVVVHFPIALVIAALAAEMLRRREAARVCLTLGAAGAIAAAAMGWALWLHTSAAGERETYMTLHQWVGTAMAVWTAMTWGLERSKLPRRYYLAALVIAAAGIGLVGHWGGLLVWGVNYYRW